MKPLDERGVQQRHERVVAHQPGGRAGAEDQPVNELVDASTSSATGLRSAV